MFSANSRIMVNVLLITLFVHLLGASTLIEPQTPETECYCKCPCNPITTTATPSTTTATPSTTAIRHLPFECEPSVTGYFPHPNDPCQRYLYCSRGMLRFELTCFAGMYFTPGNDRCTSDVPPGCENPDASVILFGNSGESKSINMKWGECYNLEDIDMDDRVSAIRFLKNDCIYLCDTNNCTCSVIKADMKNCVDNLANCDFNKRAKSIGSCLYANH